MTKKQIENYNLMREALLEIKAYDSTEKLRKDSERDWGLEFEEVLEMAYDNIQATAAFAVKGVRAIK